MLVMLEHEQALLVGRAEARFYQALRCLQAEGQGSEPCMGGFLPWEFRFWDLISILKGKNPVST